MLQRVFRCYSLLFVAVLLAMSSGCGGPKAPYKVAPLEGTITFKGQPLDGVVVQFLVGDNRPSGALVRGGKFKAVHTPSQDGVPVGKCTLVVTWGGSEESSPPAEYKELFEKYGADGSAPYVFEVTKPDKNFTIALE